jgi:hypothetical protein
MPHLLVIGGPSIDTLHFNHQTAISAGGAGLYTALSAARSGCQVSMYSPKPRQIPEVFEPLERRLEAWLGPRVALEDMPHFEIAHNGDQATYLDFLWVKKRVWILQDYRKTFQFMMACISRPSVMFNCSWNLPTPAVNATRR